MKRPKKYVTNRAQYERAKKMDRAEFDHFLTEIYKEGFKDGRQSIKGVELEDVMAAIAQTKGVGHLLHARIRKEVEKLYEGGVEESSQRG